MVIVLSANPAAAREVVALGAQATLSKPFELQDLLDTVARYLPPQH